TPLPRRSNLLVETSTYVGQERARRDVAALVRSFRLVTLTGPPGIGKTRLALQVARSFTPEPRDGIWLVECAAFTDRDHLIEAITALLKARVSQEGDPLANLVAEIEIQNVLLVLDNCEHVIDAAAAVAAAIGQSCPSISILATSRESLGVSGERVYHVPSLTVPPTEVHRLVDLMQYDAAALFLERSRAVSDRFEAGEDNISAIREIVGRLDGLPLAIELAAARTDQMSLTDMLRQLDDRLEFLSWGRRDAVPRQRTLRALIDWSFDLLSRSERVLLRRVAVFAGGWNLDAAGTICTDGNVSGSQCLGILSSLVRKNLVVANTAGGPTRYSLLDSIHSYLLDKLDAAGETIALAGRHANWFASFAETMGATGTELQLQGRRQLAEIEMDNVNAALKWSLQDDG
ncbi:MAG: AAA family ATPase, partial [Candidatus Eremiobacteraeota bacterium]|nr:AAA family ATPase [Candidatus Eremiobacteraeota bacterium]